MTAATATSSLWPSPTIQDMLIESVLRLKMLLQVSEIIMEKIQQQKENPFY